MFVYSKVKRVVEAKTELERQSAVASKTGSRNGTSFRIGRPH